MRENGESADGWRTWLCRIKESLTVGAGRDLRDQLVWSPHFTGKESEIERSYYNDPTNGPLSITSDLVHVSHISPWTTAQLHIADYIFPRCSRR